MWLWVLETNDRATKFYEKHGYETIGNAAFQMETNPYDNCNARKTMNHTVTDRIEINATTGKVWEILTQSQYIRQWDELPDEFSENQLRLGSIIKWPGFSKLTVTTFDIGSELRLSLELPRVAMKPSEYDISYRYLLTASGDRTILDIAIGDFAPIPNPQSYVDASLEFVQNSKAIIQQLAEN